MRMMKFHFANGGVEVFVISFVFDSCVPVVLSAQSGRWRCGRVGAGDRFALVHANEAYTRAVVKESLDEVAEAFAVATGEAKE